MDDALSSLCWSPTVGEQLFRGLRRSMRLINSLPPSQVRRAREPQPAWLQTLRASFLEPPNGVAASPSMQLRAVHFAGHEHPSLRVPCSRPHV